MSELLRTALRELGDVAPPPDLAGGALRRARRDRRRLVGTLVAVAVLATAAVVVPAVLLDRTPAPVATAPAPAYQVVGYRSAAGSPGPVTGQGYWVPGQDRFATVGAELFLDISPDGEWAAVYNDTEFDKVGVVRLDRLAAAGPDAVDWLPLSARTMQDPWSPDSSRLLLKVGGAKSGKLAVVDLPALTVRPVTLAGPADLFTQETRLGWRADGQGFLALRAAWSGIRPTVMTAGVRSTLWSFDGDGGVARRWELPAVMTFAPAPDGRRVLLQEAHPPTGPEPLVPAVTYSVLDLATGTVTGTPARAVDWYDDDHLFTVQHDGGRAVLAILDLRTGEQVARRVVRDDPEVTWFDIQLVRPDGPAPSGAIVV